MVSTSMRYEDGHYQIGLPLRQKELNMPNNGKIIEQHALQLLKRLQRYSSFYEDYAAFMDDLIVKGYTEKVPQDELKRDEGKVWYIQGFMECH